MNESVWWVWSHACSIYAQLLPIHVRLSAVIMWLIICCMHGQGPGPGAAPFICTHTEHGLHMYTYSPSAACMHTSLLWALPTFYPKLASFYMMLGYIYIIYCYPWLILHAWQVVVIQYMLYRCTSGSISGPVFGFNSFVLWVVGVVPVYSETSVVIVNLEDLLAQSWKMLIGVGFTCMRL